MAKGKIGRPSKFNEPTIAIGVRVPVSTYDRLCAEARQSGSDVATCVRARLEAVSFSKLANRPSVP
jgi:hypothetical protein